MCVTAPFFMAHTCRESCGVCGFLSPSNVEEQEVGQRSYTDFTSKNFHCGAYKPLCEINNTTCEVDGGDFDLRSVDSSEKEPELFLSVKESFCTATLITDRWVLTAAHCYDNFGASGRSIRANTIRVNTLYTETIEIKRVYRHPEYRFPKSYNDIALIELGRRIVFDYDKFGDSPVCIDQGVDKVDKVATVEGFGQTEKGTKGKLLEANVTVISNQECKEALRYNITKEGTKMRITTAIPLGLEYGLLCARGIYNPDNKLFSDACKGDSGGPLFQQHDSRRYIIGIVSAGLGCGRGYPGWYTRVQSYTKWVRCVIDQSIRFKNKVDDVLNACNEVVEEAPKCEEAIADPDVALFDLDLRSEEAAQICQEYNTGTIEELETTTTTTTAAAPETAGAAEEAENEAIFGKK